MKKGKLIVIEGTDCSGKETQTNMLLDRLSKEGYGIDKMDFPQYDSPTGRIVGGCYLGKPEICKGFFPETAGNVDPKIASLYYAADRRYALPKIEQIINSGNHLILDRYVSANMGHQGGKAKSPEERKKIYQFLNDLEYGLMELPNPDMTIFLYMPAQVGMELNKGRVGVADQHENNPNHLHDAENAYLELSQMYDWTQINCAPDKTISSLRTIEDIHEEVYKKTIEKILRK